MQEKNKMQQIENTLGSDSNEEKFENLKMEIGRLNRELDLVISENIQSAKCGLALLEEKCKYQQKCAELEMYYDQTRHELEAAKQALKKLAASQKTTNENGIEQEHALLNESAAMELSFTSQVQDLENEVKHLRRELTLVSAEKDHFNQEIADVTREKMELEAEKMQLKQSLKELKISEAKSSTRNSELEEENYILHRELSRLQTIQMELKTSKSEINRLLEENLHLQEQIEELKEQKGITEGKLQDTIEALEIERETNTMLRKEVEMYSCKSLLLKTRSLADSILEMKDIGDSSDGASSLLATSITSRTESTNSTEGHNELLPQVFNELKMLRKQLEDLESLARSNPTSRISFPLSQGITGPESEPQISKLQLSAFTAGVNAMNRLEKQMEVCTTSGSNGEFPEDSSKEQKEILNDKVRGSHADLGIVGHKSTTGSFTSTSITDILHILNNEVLGLREKLMAFATASSSSSYGSTFNYISETAGENLVLAQNTLITLNEQLLGLANEIYAVDGQPSSTCNLPEELSNVGGGCDTISGEQEPLASSSSSFSCNSSKEFQYPLKQQQQKHQQFLTKTCNLKKQASLAQHRFSTVRTAVHHLMASSSMKNGFQRNTSPDILKATTKTTMETMLVKRVNKLEKLVSKKQKDIGTLQAIIKSNKTTAQTILVNIRRKYDEEKKIVEETILKLSRELNMLKDETVALAGLRETFMSRCKENIMNVRGLALELEVAEEEKKLLRKILKISINRKVDLQHRLQAMKENLQGIKSDIPEKRKKTVQFSKKAIYCE